MEELDSIAVQRRSILKISGAADVLLNKPAGEFRALLRVSRELFEVIVNTIRPHVERRYAFVFFVFSHKVVRTGTLRSKTAEEQLMLFLSFVAHTGNYSMLSNLFGMSKSTAYESVHRVTNAICLEFASEVRWPSLAEAQDSDRRVAERFNASLVSSSL